MLDELESHYDEVSNFSERRDQLEASTLEYLSYGDEEEDMEGMEAMEDIEFEDDNK